MTGPEHYREAERLLEQAGAGNADQAWDTIQLNEPPSPLFAAAHVHATLALAAACAMPTVSHYMGIVDPNSGGDNQQITAWGRAIGWTATPNRTPIDVPADYFEDE